VPVVLGTLSDLGERDALLVVEDDLPSAAGASQPMVVLSRAHAAGCTCCKGRDVWAEALGSLFVGMVKNDRPRFDRVVAVLNTTDAARLFSVLAEDRLLAGRYRAG